MKLWMKIIIGLFLGMIVGLFMGESSLHLKIIGDIFLGLINMIIVPLVLSSMAVGVSSIHDPAKLGRVGTTTLLFFLATTVIAILIGISAVKLFPIGEGVVLPGIARYSERVPTPISELLLSIVPSNPVRSLSEGNILQIIVFALFLGIAIYFAGNKGKPLYDFLESLSQVMYRLTSMVMELSPIGVFAIMAWVTGTFGAAILWPLLQFLVLYYLACFLHMGIVYCGTLKGILRLSPLPFFKGMSDAMAMAFSTCSSSATLPVSMRCVEENLGVPKHLTGFILPLGSTINMNGAALYQGMAAVFVAQAYGIELSFYSLITLTVTAALSAIGAAGVPGSGFMMLTVVFTSVGIPIEGLAILAGIDRLREMISTVLNVLGDGLAALFVAHREGELDLRVYSHSRIQELDAP